MSAPFAPFISRAFSKLFNSPDALEGLGPQLVPIIVGHPLPPDMYFGAGQRLMAGNALVPAVAAQISVIQLFNPVNSGVIAVLHEIRPQISADLEVFVCTSAATNLDNRGNPRDGRQNANGVCQVRVSADAAVVPAGFTDVGSIITGIPLQQPFVLSPGFGVALTPTAVNTAIAAGFYWSERQAEDSELA